MTDYCIQKTTSDPYLAKRCNGWVPAYGLKARSYPKASNDLDAIKQFEETTKFCKAPYRLIKYAGIGYNVQAIEIANNGIPKK